MLTLRIQACVYAPCEVQTGSEPECLQTHQPCQMTLGGNRLGYHLEPVRYMTFLQTKESEMEKALLHLLQPLQFSFNDVI